MSSQGAASASEIAVAVGLWPSVLVRGLTALFLGACGFLMAIPTPATLIRGVAIYWAVDGLCSLWIGLARSTITLRKTALVVRGSVGIAAALILGGLPLLGLFGQYRPGQTLAFLLALPLALGLMLLQIVLVAVIDVPVAFEIRRRIPGEWSLLLAAAVAIVLSLLAAAAFLGVPFHLGGALGVVGVIGGVLLIVGAFRLRSAR
jgi:hypothetical protein